MWSRTGLVCSRKIADSQCPVIGRRCLVNNAPRRQPHPTYRAGLVTADHAQSNSPDVLIDKIDQPSRPLCFRSPGSKSQTLVVLLSSKFASFALQPDLPSKVLAKVLPNGFTDTVEVFTAVVDKLPSSAGALGGSHGLSYLLMTAPDESRNKSPVYLNPSAQRPGFITFEGTAAPYTGPNPRASPFAQQRSTEIQIPLAQTIFSTGWPSTLIQTTWRYDHGASSRVGEAYLESKTLPLPALYNMIDMDLPLIPLTPARQVTRSMGNIIKELSPHFLSESLPSFQDQTADRKHSPASKELEQAVSDFFTLRGTPPEAVQVWAVIIPNSVPLSILKQYLPVKYLIGYDRVSGHIRDLWAKRTPGEVSDLSPVITYSNRISTLPSEMVFNLKARLARVLSGGGGWGEKAGLLSLDPDAEYSTRVIREDQGWDFDPNFFGLNSTRKAGPGQNASGVINKGDLVMFFISVKEDQVRRKLPALLPTPTPTIVFGALPSSIDEMPDNTTAPEREKGMTNLVHYREGLFGILSEGGAFVSIGNRSGKNDDLLLSKIDAPHACISISECTLPNTPVPVGTEHDTQRENIPQGTASSSHQKALEAKEDLTLLSDESSRTFDFELAQALGTVLGREGKDGAESLSRAVTGRQDESTLGIVPSSFSKRRHFSSTPSSRTTTERYFSTGHPIVYSKMSGLGNSTPDVEIGHASQPRYTRGKNFRKAREQPNGLSSQESKSPLRMKSRETFRKITANSQVANIEASVEEPILYDWTKKGIIRLSSHQSPSENRCPKLPTSQALRTDRNTQVDEAIADVSIRKVQVNHVFRKVHIDRDILILEENDSRRRRERLGPSANARRAIRHRSALRYQRDKKLSQELFKQMADSDNCRE